MFATGTCWETVFLYMISVIAVSVNCYIVEVHNQLTINQSAAVGQHIRLACLEPDQHRHDAPVTNVTKFRWSVAEGSSSRRKGHRFTALLTLGPRFRLDQTEGTLSIDDLRPADSGLYKCSATSGPKRIVRRHTVLNVLAAAPALDHCATQPDELTDVRRASMMGIVSSVCVRVATESNVQLDATAGQNVTLACLESSQRPTNDSVFSWYRTNSSTFLNSDHDPRFRLDHADGTLHIQDVRPTDSDAYKCFVPHAVDLIYRRTTMLKVWPKGQPIKRQSINLVRVETEPTIHLAAAIGDHIRLTCIESLRLTNASFFSWYRANRTLLHRDTITDPRFRIDTADGSLYIDDVRAADSDSYKCVVPHAVDLIYRGTTQLNVEEVAGNLVDGEQRSVGSDSSTEKVQEIVTTTTASLSSAPLPNTAPETSERSTKVLVEPHPSTTETDLMQMRISWSPLNHTDDADAAGLAYRVLWLRTDAAQPRWAELYVDDLRRSFADVSVATYGRYAVGVRVSPQSKAREFLQRTDQAEYDHRHTFGYPSEGVPSAAPGGLRQCDHPAAVTAAVCLEWTAVDAAAVNGGLRGYRVRTWYADDVGVRTAERIVDVFDGGLRTEVQVSSGVATGLGGGYYASVAVVNGRTEGPLSGAISLGEV